MIEHTHISLAHDNGGRFMRDPTRGGLGSVMQEIHQVSQLGVLLEQDSNRSVPPFEGG